MSSGLFATPTPTPIGIPQADGSGFIDTDWLHASVTPTPNDLVLSDGSGHINPDWLLTDGTGSLHNDGAGHLSWVPDPTTFSGTVALAKLTLAGANGSITILNGLVTAYVAPT